MTWDELLPVLLGMMGRRVMVQAWHTSDNETRGHTPFLSAFGELRGGPMTQIGGSDALMLELASSVTGSNGTVLLREPMFTGADEHQPGTVEIRLGVVTMGIVATGPAPDPDQEYRPSGIMLGTVAGPAEDDEDEPDDEDDAEPVDQA